MEGVVAGEGQFKSGELVSSYHVVSRRIKADRVMVLERVQVAPWQQTSEWLCKWRILQEEE